MNGSSAVLTAILLVSGMNAALGQSDDCQDCHGRAEDMADLVDDLRPGLVVDQSRFDLSVHSTMSCDECHFDYEDDPHGEETFTATCVECHEDEAEVVANSAHATITDGQPISCSSCHGVHDAMLPSERESRLHPLNVIRTCGECHFEVDAATASVDELLHEPFTDDSHARGLLHAGLTVSATCVTCHGGHEVRASGDPESRVSRSHIIETCGACHVGIVEQHNAGVHSVPASADQDSDPEGAVCSDCHRPHDISRTDVETFRLGIVDECGHCHEYEAETFYDTIHGKVSHLGGERAAKCQDCHGAHGILPPSDPESPLSSEHIVATCGKCHEGSHAQFTEYLPHAVHSDRERWPWLFWSFWSMTTLLVGTMSLALLHTLLFLIRLTLDRKEWKAHQQAVRAGAGDQRLYRRFNRSHRTLHLLMIISFMTLALTGMLHKFSWAPWARVLTDAMGGVDTTHVLHRVAALLLIGVFSWHVFTAVRVKRQRKWSWWSAIDAPDSIVFNTRDLAEAKATMRWFFGKGPRPAYGRFTYWEKFDYFAVFWGVFIIGLTGLSLWFPVAATKLLPGWTLNVFTIVHSDEALLASAFIFTVHFFNANFRPDKFPMDMIMFTGRITLEELKYERPLEYQELMNSGELESHLVDAMPSAAVKSFRVFASLALLTGVGLISLIIYALLTG